METPAWHHTGGDAVDHCQRANVMHMGDLLFNRAHPNIDRAQGTRVDNWIKVLEALKGFEDNVSPNARLTLALILAGASGLLAQAPPRSRR